MNTKMSRRYLPLLSIAVLFCAVLTGCGYHLGGSGRGAVPADVKRIMVTGAGEASTGVLPLLRDYIREHANGYTVTGDRALAGATLHLDQMSETFNPSAYDAQGVATTYNLVLTGSMRLLRQGKPIWSSGNIQVQATVYAVGGPVSIESARARMRGGLQQRWVQEAWVRFSSGF